MTMTPRPAGRRDVFDARRDARIRARRGRLVKRGLPVLGLLLALLAGLLWAAMPDSAPTATSTTVKSTTTSTTAPPTTTTTDPGVLPQTTAEPAFGTALTSQMTTLWSAIQSDSLAQGMTVFFPRSAYIPMKTGLIADPAGDYTSRLIGFFNLDLEAYHSALGPNPSQARLINVLVDPSFASWISAGSCENGVGYWHLPGVRLVYSTASGIKSFRVASLISWRGTWYVVHLGPNPRPSNVGTVDDPQDAPGTPGPAGGC